MKALHILSPLFIALLISQTARAVPMTAVLGVKANVPMAQLAQNVMDPASERYQKFYTPAEIRRLAAPSASDYKALVAQLQAKGFTITHETTTHLWITVQADSSVFENVFSTRLILNFRGEHSPMVREQIPSDLPLVERIVGLDNSRHSIPKYVLPETRKHKNPPAAGAGAPADNGGGIAQAAIKTAYGLDKIYASGVNGSGQHIAVATYSGFTISDVQAFYQGSALSPLPTVDQVIFNGTPAFDAESAVETELDAEFSGMIAPGAAVHVFASATNDDAGEQAVFTAILDDNRAKVVNYSWGDCETNLTSAHATAMDTVFQQAVAQGVNVMIASGDSGSASCNPGTGSTATVADWPAADDYVVAVGGTKLTTSGTSMSETAWSCTLQTIALTGCSGGGVSTQWAMPAWQNGALPSTFSKRGYPDVAFNADPSSGQDVYVTYQTTTPQWLKIGGTSMAAPQWTGFMTLVNAARVAKGKTILGLANPFLYGATPSQRSTLFHDVTSGSNGAYSAGAGWDAVTGWGSMQGENLLTFLTSQ